MKLGAAINLVEMAVVEVKRVTPAAAVATAVAKHDVVTTDVVLADHLVVRVDAVPADHLVVKYGVVLGVPLVLPVDVNPCSNPIASSIASTRTAMA